MAFGEIADRPEFTTYQIGNKLITLDKKKSNSKELGGEKKVDYKATKDLHFHLDASQFIVQTREKIGYSFEKKMKPVRHADISKNFTMQFAKPSSTKNLISKEASLDVMSPEERRVRKAINSNEK